MGCSKPATQTSSKHPFSPLNPQPLCPCGTKPNSSSNCSTQSTFLFIEWSPLGQPASFQALRAAQLWAHKQLKVSSFYFLFHLAIGCTWGRSRSAASVSITATCSTSSSISSPSLYKLFRNGAYRICNGYWCLALYDYSILLL